MRSTLLEGLSDGLKCVLGSDEVVKLLGKYLPKTKIPLRIKEEDEYKLTAFTSRTPSAFCTKDPSVTKR